MKQKSDDSIHRSKRFTQHQRLTRYSQKLRRLISRSTEPMDDFNVKGTMLDFNLLSLTREPLMTQKRSRQRSMCNLHTSEQREWLPTTGCDSGAADRLTATCETTNARPTSRNLGPSDCHRCREGTAALNVQRHRSARMTCCVSSLRPNYDTRKTGETNECSLNIATPASSSKTVPEHPYSTCFSSKGRSTKSQRKRDRHVGQPITLPMLLITGLVLCCHSMVCNAYPARKDSNSQSIAPSSSNKNIFIAELTENPSSSTDDFAWPTMLEGKTEESSEVSGTTRKTRAAKRGVPPKYLVMHTYLQRLYSRNSFFLEILKNGKVRGTRNEESPYNAVRIDSVAVGVLAIYGTKSRHYLAMNQKGNLYGSKTFTEECKFYEKLAGGKRYFTYEAVQAQSKKKRKKRPRYVGFGKNGKPKRGHRIKGTNRGALFTKIPAGDNARLGRPKRRRD